MPNLVRSLELVVRRRKTTHYPLPTTHSKVKQGFTLIELLIVISIIGILATVTLASYNSAQEKARDGIRKSDLAQMKRALELSKADCQGSAYYPNLGGSDVTAYTALGNYLSDPDLKYISSTPTDPKNAPPQQYAYATSTTAINRCPAADGSGTLTVNGADNYALWVRLERTSDSDGTNSRTKCAGKPGNATWNAAGYYVICNN